MKCPPWHSLRPLPIIQQYRWLDPVTSTTHHQFHIWDFFTRLPPTCLVQASRRTRIHSSRILPLCRSSYNQPSQVYVRHAKSEMPTDAKSWIRRCNKLRERLVERRKSTSLRGGLVVILITTRRQVGKYCKRERSVNPLMNGL